MCEHGRVVVVGGSLCSTLIVIAHPKPNRHAQACAGKQYLGKPSFFPCRQRSVSSQLHIGGKMTKDLMRRKKLVESDLQLKTQLSDACQLDLIFSNTSPELLRIDQHFQNVPLQCEGMKVQEFLLESK